MSTAVSTNKRPYFFWDYDITEDEIRAILRDGEPFDKAWVISRILEHARWNDIWHYLTGADIRENSRAYVFVESRIGSFGPMRWTGGHAMDKVQRSDWVSGWLTPLQASVIESFFATAAGQQFYLTGGTALAAFHLHHRTSIDLDLFTLDDLALREADIGPH